MTLLEFSNGLRVLLNIDEREFLSCINQEDREYFGDKHHSDKFFKNPHRYFCELPTQDQERLFAIITKRNQDAGYTK